MTTIVPWLGAICFLATGVSAIDGATTIPLGAVVGSAVTVFLVGMWVNGKVTRFEVRLEQVREQQIEIKQQQAENIKRLDTFDNRLCELDDRVSRRGHF